MVDILWNDPQEEEGRKQGERGGGSIFFGPDVTERFLSRNGLRLVIRSHEVCEESVRGVMGEGRYAHKVEEAKGWFQGQRRSEVST